MAKQKKAKKTTQLTTRKLCNVQNSASKLLLEVFVRHLFPDGRNLFCNLIEINGKYYVQCGCQTFCYKTKSGALKRYNEYLVENSYFGGLYNV